MASQRECLDVEVVGATSEAVTSAAKPKASQYAQGRVLFLVVAGIVTVYALLSGLRTVSDFDTGWQLASGRWIAQHHRIFSTDVFSYTAYGQPWIYPVGAELLFYASYLLGGYALLSWIGALACAGTVALLLRRGSLATAALAALAVPLIAYRSIPRADLFTVVLFAAYLSILWENFQTGRGRLWLLPALMIAWVNLHLGFVSGLALMGGFAALDVLELLLAEPRREAARQRLRRELPWFGAAALATLLNPWGWGIYTALVRQDRAMAEHARFITEWFGLPLNWAAISSGFSLRNGSAIYPMLALAGIAAVVSLAQRQPGAALLLAGASYQTIHHIRMEALTACVIVVLGGSAFHSAFAPLAEQVSSTAVRHAFALAAAVLVALFVGIRSYDVVSDRTYTLHDAVATFGAGEGWWYPEQAAAFLDRANLPGTIFNTFDEGGFVLWRLGEHHRDYADGRAIPFGTAILETQERLLEASPDSAEWAQAAERYNTTAVLLPLSRLQMTPLARLKDFCNSRAWRPVYLDELGAVFVRRTLATEEFIRRFGIDCATVQLPAQPVPETRGIAFNRWANAAAVLAHLQRPYEALQAADHALAISPDAGDVHLLRGNLYYGMRRGDDAKREFLQAVASDPSENTWASLGLLYASEGQSTEATHAMRQAVRLSLQPYLANLRLARYFLGIADPRSALTALDDCLRTAPKSALTDRGPSSLNFLVARAQADAFLMLADVPRAIAAGEQAVAFAPTDPKAWSELASLYGRAGRKADQQNAQEKATELTASSGTSSAQP